MSVEPIKGSCQCGKTSFTIDLPSLEQNKMDGRVAKDPQSGELKYCAHTCWCGQCAKSAGGFSQTFFRVPFNLLHIIDDSTLKHYESTPGSVLRSFCSTCGSSLFFRVLDLPCIAISASAFDREQLAKYIKVSGHIFCKDSLIPGLPAQINDGTPKYSIGFDSPQYT